MFIPSTTSNLQILLVVIQINTQVMSSFTGPTTGITFQRFFGAAPNSPSASPSPKTLPPISFGQLSFPTPSGSGWGGISLADDLVGLCYSAAWPNGNAVMSSFRLAEEEEDSPPVVSGGFNVRTIEQGTLANASHMTFTSLCQGCIDSRLGFGAQGTAGSFEMGWALADSAVANAADPATELSFHNKGFDSFNAQLSLARSASFGDWAAMAGVVSNIGFTLILL